MEIAVLHGEVSYRVEEALDVQGEGDEHSSLEAAAKHHAAAEEDDQPQAQGADHLHGGEEEGRVAARLESGVEMRVVGRAELADVRALPVHALDHPHTRYVLLELGVHNRQPLPHPEEGGAREALPHDQHEEQKRNDREGDQRQLHVHQEHGRDDASEAQHVSDAEHDNRHELLQVLDVVLDPRHRLAYLVPVEVGHREFMGMSEQIDPETVQYPLGEPRNQPEVQEAARELHQRGQQKDAHDDVQPVAVFNPDVVVYGQPHDPGHRHDGTRIDQHGGYRDDHDAPVREHVPEQSHDHFPVVYRPPVLLVNVEAGPSSHHGATPSGTSVDPLVSCGLSWRSYILR